MYRQSYADVTIDSPADARAIERRALNRAVSLLKQAEGMGPNSLEERQALAFTTQLWSIFVKDLARPDNDLPAGLKAQLTGVGLGVMKEAQRISLGLSRDLASLADICGIIRDGLA